MSRFRDSMRWFFSIHLILQTELGSKVYTFRPLQAPRTATPILCRDSLNSLFSWCSLSYNLQATAVCVCVCVCACYWPPRETRNASVISSSPFPSFCDTSTYCTAFQLLSLSQFQFALRVIDVSDTSHYSWYAGTSISWDWRESLLLVCRHK
jgi:hypothetical protein